MSESSTKTDEIRNGLDEESLDLFWQFIGERQKVWYRRVVEGRPAPWTGDEILQEYRFTNVYRELDPGTQYVIQDILEEDASRRDKIFNVMIYRLIGRLETHEYLGFQSLDSFDAAEFEEQLKHRRDELGETVFTGAYMVSGYNQMGSSDKVENVAALFEEITDETTSFDNILSTRSMKGAYDLIRSQPGFGNFLSYQVIVDLLYPVDYYDGGSVLPFSPDDWSSPGPGAQKGLNQLVTEFNGFTRLDVMRWLRQNQQKEFDRLDLEFPYLETEDGGRLELSLANIQNCLCEFYKYHKILHSNGRARRCFRNDEARSCDELRDMYETAPLIRLPNSF
ncbi:hypothetical protein C453_01715 [Haloferax elongans ATCC BAA-1513]|uniref:5-hmdU DNA kinase helical domain-containing protein n=2 Tax=Haloferax elongans TaxID=403191 RepID=M0HWZ6_HALEO|nr:hypothetical protein C453_01715 [Haloferax elongans ATCC BAA-1513]